MRTVNEVLNQINVAQARIGEIYTGITNEVNSDADLSGLTSTSKTAEFNLWKYIWAVMAYIQEAIFGEAKSEIQAIVDSSFIGTDPWMQLQCFKFQYGDALSFNNTTGKYYYAVIDSVKQIIKRCAIVSAGGITTIKVAKESAGVPVVLDAGELAAFKAYIDRIQMSGGNILVVSYSSDKLNAPITIYYSALIKLDDLKPLIESAFTNYLANLPFNGEYSITKHQDALQAVANVNDVVMGAIQAKIEAGSYVPVNRVYYPVSGYIEKDSTITFDDMITYVAQ